MEPEKMPSREPITPSSYSWWDVDSTFNCKSSVFLSGITAVYSKMLKNRIKTGIKFGNKIVAYSVCISILFFVSVARIEFVSECLCCQLSEF